MVGRMGGRNVDNRTLPKIRAIINRAGPPMIRRRDPMAVLDMPAGARAWEVPVVPNSTAAKITSKNPLYSLGVSIT